MWERRRKRQFAPWELCDLIGTARANELTHMLYQILLLRETKGLSKPRPDISSSGPANQRTRNSKQVPSQRGDLVTMHKSRQ